MGLILRLTLSNTCITRSQSIFSAFFTCHHPVHVFQMHFQFHSTINVSFSPFFDFFFHCCLYKDLPWLLSGMDTWIHASTYTDTRANISRWMRTAYKVLMPDAYLKEWKQMAGKRKTSPFRISTMLRVFWKYFSSFILENVFERVVKNIYTGKD